MNPKYSRLRLYSPSMTYRVTVIQVGEPDAKLAMSEGQWGVVCPICPQYFGGVVFSGGQLDSLEAGYRHIYHHVNDDYP